MPNPLSMQMVRAATAADLRRIRRDYVAGAEMLVRAGFDAIELHLGHGYLLSGLGIGDGARAGTRLERPLATGPA